jgi:hypothetical protein
MIVRNILMRTPTEPLSALMRGDCGETTHVHQNMNGSVHIAAPARRIYQNAGSVEIAGKNIFPRILMPVQKNDPKACDHCPAFLPAHNELYLTKEEAAKHGKAIQTKPVCPACGKESVRWTSHGIKGE